MPQRQDRRKPELPGDVVGCLPDRFGHIGLFVTSMGCAKAAKMGFSERGIGFGDQILNAHVGVSAKRVVGA